MLSRKEPSLAATIVRHTNGSFCFLPNACAFASQLGVYNDEACFLLNSKREKKHENLAYRHTFGESRQSGSRRCTGCPCSVCVCVLHERSMESVWESGLCTVELCTGLCAVCRADCVEQRR